MAALISGVLGPSFLEAQAPAALRGTWRAEDGKFEVRVETGRLAVWRDGDLRFHRIAGPSEHGLSVWTSSGPKPYRIRRDGAALVFDAGDGERRLAAAEAPRHTREPVAMKLGAADVDEERVEAIKVELRKRRRADQKVRAPLQRLAQDASKARTEELMGAMRRVDADNTAWLRRVVAEIGWIDAERFGRRAAGAAFLLVQHCDDLGLMLAARPRIEAEMKAGRGDAQQFALLYDRVEMRLGRRQLYGTQLVGRPKETLHLYPIVDADNVEARRKQMRLFPLKTYLGLIEKQFGSKVVRH